MAIEREVDVANKDGNSKSDSPLIELYKSSVHTIFIPLVFVLITGMFTWMNKLEERQYVLQRDAVTENKLNVTEQRIMSHIDIRLRDLDSKLVIVINELSRMREERRQ